MVCASKHNLDIDASIPARGLHGEAYHGHIFWDDLFVMPFFAMHNPAIYKSLIMYRCRRLNGARKYARENGYKGAMFPGDMRNDAFIAQHGSWNRTIPDGYRVARVRFDDQGRARSWEPFAEGWLDWDRPVDVSELPDGSMLVSDDRQGLIYRISYSP